MEIESPPYPKNSTNPEQLCGYLTELHYWTAAQIEWANEEAERLNSPTKPFITSLTHYPPTKSDRYLTLAVPDMYVSWTVLRLIRERWDGVLRNFEDNSDWDSDPCIYHRIGVVKAASILLSLAFLPQEQREAKEADLIRKQRIEMIKGLRKSFGEDFKGLFGVSKKDAADEDDKDDEIDFDALFNPTEDE